MLQDPERYFLTTDKASVMRRVLSFVSAAGAKAESSVAHGSCLSLEDASKDGCDRMILELRRPMAPAAGAPPKVRNLRTSHFGRTLVVTGDATTPEIFHEIDALRHPYSPRQLKSGLLAFGRTIFYSLRLTDPQN
jgi:hypothetical protein